MVGVDFQFSRSTASHRPRNWGGGVLTTCGCDPTYRQDVEVYLTIFELVKLALDELYQEASDEYGDDVDDRVKNRIGYLSINYGKLDSKDRVPIDYSDPATRFAYVFKYV